MPSRIQWKKHQEKIIHMYEKEEKSPQEIADYFSQIYKKNIQRNSIANFLRKLGKMRSQSHSSFLKVTKGKIEHTIEKLIQAAKEKNRFHPKKSRKREMHQNWKPINSTRLHRAHSGLIYRQIKIHSQGRWLYEHRHLMEKKLGRKLLKSEHVHHIDEDTLNNSLTNLMVMDAKEHLNYHRRKKNALCLPKTA